MLGRWQRGETNPKGKALLVKRNKAGNVEVSMGAQSSDSGGVHAES